MGSGREVGEAAIAPEEDGDFPRLRAGARRRRRGLVEGVLPHDRRQVPGAAVVSGTSGSGRRRQKDARGDVEVGGCPVSSWRTCFAKTASTIDKVAPHLLGGNSFPKGNISDVAVTGGKGDKSINSVSKVAGSKANSV